MRSSVTSDVSFLVVAFLGFLLVIFATGILVLAIAFVLDIFGLSIPFTAYSALVVVALVVSLAWAIVLWNRRDRRAHVLGRRTGRHLRKLSKEKTSSSALDAHIRF